jgi:hypothetical protein
MWLLLIFLNTEDALIHESAGTSSIFVNLITLIASLWSFVLLIQSLREVQQFTLRRALANVFAVWILSWGLFFISISVIRFLFL